MDRTLTFLDLMFGMTTTLVMGIIIGLLMCKWVIWNMTKDKELEDGTVEAKGLTMFNKIIDKLLRW